MSEPMLLLVDDDPVLTQVLARAFRRRGYQVREAHCASEAMAQLDAAVDYCLLDLKIADESGLTLIPHMKLRQPALNIVMLTGYSSISTAVEAIKLGANNYLCKPADADEIEQAFHNTHANPDTEIMSQPPSVNRLEWEHIQKVLTDNDGNISATARALGMHRRTLQRKLQKKPTRQ